MRPLGRDSATASQDMAEAKRAAPALVVKNGLTEAKLVQECSDDHMLDIGEFKISWKD